MVSALTKAGAGEKSVGLNTPLSVIIVAKDCLNITHSVARMISWSNKNPNSQNKNDSYAAMGRWIKSVLRMA